MQFDELNYDQKNKLAGDLLVQLADEGMYAEVLGVDWDAPSYGEMISALDILGEDYVREHMEDIEFTEDDFGWTEERSAECAIEDYPDGYDW